MDADRTDRRSPSNAAFLYLSIRDLLAGKIAAGEFEPGTLLKEARISAQLGVSRAPVRRALALLADAGAIHSAAGQGFIVGRNDAPVRITTRRLVGAATWRMPASAKALRLPTCSSPHVISTPGCVTIA